MKLISLKFKAFGAYLKEQFIDFESLSKSGLFLISGKTGAGKTVILDAVTYALYGKSSGGNRGDIYAMRCQFASNQDDTEVELVFEIKGKRYKFTRTLQQKRVNIASFQNAMFMSDDGRFVPFFENPHLRDVEEKATELIGLNYEQFRQVIILPQGQFEKLLVAKSEDKEKILVSLFGAEKWQRAANIYFERVNEKKRLLETEKMQLKSALESFGCENADELLNLLTKKEEEYKAAKEREDVLRKKHVETKEIFEKQFALADRFENIERLEKRNNALLSMTDEIQQIREKVEKARIAEKLKPLYIKLETSQKDFEKRKKELYKKEDKFKKTQEENFRLKNVLQELSENEESNDNKKKKLSELEAIKVVFEKIEKLEGSLSEKRKEYELLQKSLDILVNDTKKLREENIIAEQGVIALYDEYKVLFNNYIKGISGTLAEKLTEGDACPVCGSTYHPKKAQQSQIRVDLYMLDEKDSQIKEHTSYRDTLKEKLEKYEHKLNEKKEVLQQQKLVLEKENAVIENLRNSIKCDISDSGQLSSIVFRLEKEVSEYENNIALAQTKVSASDKALIAESEAFKLTSDEYEASAKAFEKDSEIFKTALSKNGYLTLGGYLDCILEETAFNNFKERCSEYDAERKHIITMLSQLYEEVRGNEKPDIIALRAEMEESENMLLECTSENTLLYSQIENMRNALNAIRKKLENYVALEEENRKDLIFAKRIRGDNAIGIQRYLLGVVLSCVTSEANRLLENVHNGRYRLLRTLEKSGLSRKTGLELEVYDSFSGERRSVSTLSGGEKFLVSLSLSIGLSTVVQSESAGIKLETMFIDEGFGSLDPSSISDALSVLGKMKNTGSMVGIISHVDELKESIASQLEVKKDRRGSEIIIHI